MKALITLLLLHWFAICFSQVPVPSYRLSVGFQTTTNLIFPYRIEKADLGSADVIGQTAGRLDNVLFIKARLKNFSPTNLSVYTSDGKFYSFLLKYKEYPDTLNLCFADGQHASLFPSSRPTDDKLNSDAVLIQKENSFLSKTSRVGQIRARLQGIYLKDHLFWFRIEIQNGSRIDYEPEDLRFSVRYRHGSRRTASQEIQLEPSWQKHNRLISGQSRDTLVSAFPSFTIDPHKKLMIGITEKNGEREILLPVSAKTILRARKTKR